MPDWDQLDAATRQRPRPPKRKPKSPPRSHAYDVPIPPSKQPIVKKATEKAAARRRERPAQLGIPTGTELAKKRLKSAGGFLGNLWGEVETIPGDTVDLAGIFGSAIAKDAREGRGTPGLAYWAIDQAVGLPTTALGHRVTPLHAKGPWAYKDLPEAEQKGGGAFNKLSDKLIRQQIHDTKVAFGLKGGEAAKDFWYSNPLGALGSAMILAGPVTRVAAAGRAAAALKAANAGISVRDATVAGIAESFRPGVTGLETGTRAGGLIKGPGRRVPTRPTSRSPVGRGVQAVSDMISEGIDVRRPGAPFSTTRRVTRAKGRAMTINRKRRINAVMESLGPVADYVNDGFLRASRSRLGDGSYNLRRGRDAAVFAALHGDNTTDAVVAVRAAIDDTHQQIQSGMRLAHEGDASDLPTDALQGQEVFVDGRRATIRSVGDEKDGKTRVDVDFSDGGEGNNILTHHAKLTEGDEGVRVPLEDDEVQWLTERRDQMQMALDEIQGDPEMAAKFDIAVDKAADISAANEQLGRRWAKDPDHFDRVSGGRRNRILNRWREQGHVEDTRAPDDPSRLTREQFNELHPSHDWGRSGEVKDRWDALPADQEVWLYHATDEKTARQFADEGIDPVNKPETLGRQRYEAGEYAEFQPGAGLAPGLTVGFDPRSVEGYGRYIVAVKVRKGDVVPSPEQAALGAKTSGDALAVNDAQVTMPIPPENVRLIGDASRGIAIRDQRVPGHPHDEFVKAANLGEARGYVPHTQRFDSEVSQFMGGVRLPASGNVLGIPNRHRKAFPRQRNRGVLWESGMVAPGISPLVSQMFRRMKFDETMEVRTKAYAQAHPITPKTRIPKNAILVRNPAIRTPEKITERTRAMTGMSRKEFDRLDNPLIEDEPHGALNGIEEARKDSFQSKRDNPTDSEGSLWETDYENTRWIEPEKVKGVIADVFPSAPKNQGAAFFGSVNALSRMGQIYLRPFRYVLGNLPANTILLGLTNPSMLGRAVGTYAAAALKPVFKAMGKTPWDLHNRHPELYRAIKVEAGDVQAGAGLPEFYTQANGFFQGSERKLNKMSGYAAEKLGEVTDQPWRVAAWTGWARRYGFRNPDDWRTLLSTPEQLRARGVPEDMITRAGKIRDEIAQRTREDMIDFDSLTPFERQHIARYFYLWAFTRGFAKWPATFVREFPERAAITAGAAQHTRDEDRVLPSFLLSARDQARKKLDLSMLNPFSGGVETGQNVLQIAHGDITPALGYLNPTLKAVFGEGRPSDWKSWLAEAGDIYIPPAIGQAIPGTKAAGRRKTAAEEGGPSGLLGGALETGIEWNRFEVPDFSPQVKKDRDEDWGELAMKYNLMGGDETPEELTQSFRSYWQTKELEGRIKFGIMKRTGRTKLTNQEKALTRVAAYARVYGDEGQGWEQLKPAEILAMSNADADLLTQQLEHRMFRVRSAISERGTQIIKAYEAQGEPLPE